MAAKHGARATASKTRKKPAKVRHATEATVDEFQKEGMGIAAKE